MSVNAFYALSVDTPLFRLSRNFNISYPICVLFGLPCAYNRGLTSHFISLTDAEMATNQTEANGSSHTCEQKHVEPDEPIQTVGHHARRLTPEEQQKLSSDTRIVSEFKQSKLEAEAKKNWDLFYKRNTTKFFKDRHWTTREFHELCGDQVGEGRCNGIYL